VAEERTHESSSYTFRVIFDGAGTGDDRWRQLMSDLACYECWFDVRAPDFLAIAAPAEHAQAVADFLAARERSGELQYETGRSR
jgi:hypothetical protein